MARRRSSRLAEKRDIPETSQKVTLDDISSTSDPGWDDEGSDYDVEAHNSDNVSSEADVSLGEEEEAGVGDNRAPDELEGVEILEDLKDSVKSTMDNERIHRLCLRHGILKKDTLTPSDTDRPHNPPEGYMSVSRLMCMVGAVPPFPPFVVDFLRRMRIAPMQLLPNAYAYLYTLYIAYREILGEEPTFDDIHFFYNFKHRTQETPSFSYFESVPKRKIILLPFSSKAGDPKPEWFYIKQQPGCGRRWTKSSNIPSHKTQVYAITPMYY